MAIHYINNNNFEQEVMNANETVLVDFFATWCGPCRMVGPVIEEIAEENDQIKVCKIDVDQEPELAIRYGVNSIPALFVIDKGEVVSQSLGAKPKNQILAMLP